MKGFRCQLRRFLRRDNGVSAIEFALVAPILLMLLAAVVDFGALIYVRSQLETAMSTATGYALAHGQEVTAQTAPGLTLSVARILAGQAGDASSVNISINEGPRTSGAAGGLQQSGTAALAGLCYCPSPANGAISWGNARSCGSACPAGGSAGKYMTLTAMAPYTPLFFSYGLSDGGQIVVTATAALQ